MHEILIERTLRANTDKVWALLADFANLSWYTPAEEVEQIGQGVGQIRRIFMRGMDTAVEEKLETLDADKKEYSYSIADMPMHDYRVVVRLTESADGQCDLRWHATFSGVSEGLKAEDLIALMTDTYDAMLDDIERAASV